MSALKSARASLDAAYDADLRDEWLDQMRFAQTEALVAIAEALDKLAAEKDSE